jgi:hypothetical protein
MKIKCISIKRRGGWENKFPDYEFLELGKEYVVYGMILIRNNIEYYICDRMHTSFPICKPGFLFQIIDNKLSRSWFFGIIEGKEKYPSWNFKEWIDEPYFQDKLTDGEEREVEIFKFYKEFIDLEFPDSSITETAQIGNNQWLICPLCFDGWQNASDRDALVRCPTCKMILNNPYYV